jgi:hypothetical protein
MPIQTVSQAFINEGLGGFSFRNKIINGAMEIAQRGNTFTNQATTSSPNGPYTLDRWKNNRAGDAPGLTVTQSTDAPQGFINSMKLQRVSGNTSNLSTYVFHTLAREDSIPLAGETVTLSFYAKAGANYSASGNTISIQSQTTTTDSDTKVYAFSSPVTVDAKNFTLTTSWQRFSTTFTLGSTIRQFGFLVFSGTTSTALTGTAGADDSWYATGFQLEEGSVATPFERRPYGTELRLCQRYYYKITPNATAYPLGSLYVSSTTLGRCQTFFPVNMRVKPSALEQSGTAGDYSIATTNTTTTCSAVPTFNNSSVNYAATNMTVASGLTAGQAGEGRGNATGYLAWSAEL